MPGLSEPILEMIIGLQRLFITQYGDRVYLANGLEGLLNVLESLPPSSKDLPQPPLTLTLRAEAFLNRLIPVLFETPGFEANLGFNLSRESPGFLRFPGGKYVRFFRPKISKGVFGSIPHDVFAALVTSLSLPPHMAIEDWQRLATQGPGDPPGEDPPEAGMAFVWDLNSHENQLTSIGIVIAAPGGQTGTGETERYFKNSELTAECGGGRIFLAANSPGLLSRMKECCEGRSLSILDWERGMKTQEIETAQMLAFANPGVGIRELFLAGGGESGDPGEFEPLWKLEYEEAKKAMRQDSEKAFHRIPILAYSGKVTPSVTPIELGGFTVKQGAMP